MDEKYKKQLDKIIDGKHIRTVFQPIVSLRDGSVMGHEALSRMTCETEIANPEQLFRIAGESDRLWDLEQLCRTTALNTAFAGVDANPEKRLFLNVNPTIMHDEKFRQGFTRDYLKQFGIRPENIIFEITERNAVSDMKSFRGTVTHYKEQNYSIAIDDAGAGFSGLNLISDIHPHFIKLDMNLIRGIDSDSVKYALVKSMVELSRISNIALIAEGVETRGELITLIDLGIQFAQGYFLQKPDGEIRELNPEVREIITELNRRKNHVFGSQISKIYIANICTATPTIPPDMRVEDVFEKAKNDPLCFGFCVVENGTVLGIVTKNRLVQQLSGRYGFSLNQNKPVSLLMDRSFMSVDYRMPISTVSSTAMSRPPEILYDFIVVTKEDKYLGTVTVKDLLQKTTEIEVVNAKYQNPLTGLPGNVAIEQKISGCILSGKPYSVLYFDIDNFKAYNDVYGFKKGDLIILFLSETLSAHLPEGQFLGHVGGDDFVAVLAGFPAQKFCEKVISDFQMGIAKYYSAQDLENGYITAENRRGVIERFPLVSISVAGICEQDRSFASLAELTEELAKLKKRSKQQKGNSVCWLDRPEKKQAVPAQPSVHWI